MKAWKHAPAGRADNYTAHSSDLDMLKPLPRIHAGPEACSTTKKASTYAAQSISLGLHHMPMLHAHMQGLAMAWQPGHAWKAEVQLPPNTREVEAKVRGCMHLGLMRGQSV